MCSSTPIVALSVFGRLSNWHSALGSSSFISGSSRVSFAVEEEVIRRVQRLIPLLTFKLVKDKNGPWNDHFSVLNQRDNESRMRRESPVVSIQSDQGGRNDMLIRLIGRKFDDAEVQSDPKHFPFKVFSEAGKFISVLNLGGKDVSAVPFLLMPVYWLFPSQVSRRNFFDSHPQDERTAEAYYLGTTVNAIVTICLF